MMSNNSNNCNNKKKNVEGYLFFSFSLLSLLFVCRISLYIYMYACLYIFFFFCYHKLMNKDLYIEPLSLPDEA